MNPLPIPRDHTEAADRIRRILQRRPALQLLTTEEFLEGWVAIAFFAPGLHPDGYDDPESGWPRGWCVFAAEAFRRASLNELEDWELYPAEAAHAALASRRAA